MYPSILLRKFILGNPVAATEVIWSISSIERGAAYSAYARPSVSSLLFNCSWEDFLFPLAFFLSLSLSLFFLPLLPAMLLPIISSPAPEDKVHVSLIAGCCCCSSLMQKIMAPPKVIDGERMPADVYSRSKNARRCRPSTEWIVCVCVCTHTHRHTHTDARTPPPPPHLIGQIAATHCSHCIYVYLHTPDLVVLFLSKIVNK